jgi:GNAT superfamily N-acetyltransferase
MNFQAGVEVKAVTTSEELKQFIRLPFILHRGRKNFVPPLLKDEFRFYNKRYNSALQHNDTILALAYANNRCVGRIMGIIPHAFNKLKRVNTARFFNLDCINDLSVCKALISLVELWVRQKGITTIIGPFGFSDKDPQGVQVEGFKHLPVIATPVNPEYLPSLIEQCGYAKHTDCVSYFLKIPETIPSLYFRIYQRVLQKSNLNIIEFKKRSELKPFIIPVFKLINEAYSDIFGFIPLDRAEMDYLASQYFPVLNPAFVKCITNNTGDLIAFVIAMPDMSEGLKKANGRLFPFGFIYILRSMRKTKQLDLLLGAVKPDYQGLGLTAALGIKLIESAKKAGLTHMDSHLILETNRLMRAEVERLGGTVWKRYRIYSKTLVSS